MRLTRLAVENLRCHRLARLELPPGPVCFIGENGGGKTTLLEAVYALATGKSFRASQMHRLVRTGSAEARILGQWLEAEGEPLKERELRLPALGGGAAQFFVQGRAVPRSKAPEFLPVVVFCREFLAILNGPPEGRRRFIDRGLVAADPRYFLLLAETRRAQRQKHAALLSGDSRLVRAAAEACIPPAFKLQRARARFVARLSAALPAISAELALPELDALLPFTLRYQPSPAALSALQNSEPEEYRKLMLEVLPKERERRMLLRGPQRDELEILWDGRPVAQASGGQQRLALYLLKRAKVEVLARHYRAPPLFLLDDADAELDDTRLQAVIGSLARAPGQLMITAKRAEVVNFLPGQPSIFQVQNGKISI